MIDFFKVTFVLTTFCQMGTLYAKASVENGISLMYQGKSEEALKELGKYLSKKDLRAPFYSAIIYLFRDKPDVEKGLPLLEQAVRQGYAPALDTYAGLYLHGNFVPQDRHKALIYYEIAARQGYGPAQFNCGILYKNGEKIPKDLEKAFIFLTLAAHNRNDLDELVEDATYYRNQVISEMSSEEYQKALVAFGRFKAARRPKKGR